MAYNPVPSELIFKTLEDAGFTESVVGREIVYERANHRLPTLVVRVFTSAKVGRDQVAERGKDAIRVVLVYRPEGGGQTKAVKKGKRVFRTGATEDILKRMMDRARELYTMANWMSTVPACKNCGAPCYRESKRCAAYCYFKRKAAA